MGGVCQGAKEDERDCEVCKAVIDTIDKTITADERKDVEKIEKKMFQWCATSKGKDKTMCYYIGVGDAEYPPTSAPAATLKLRPWSVEKQRVARKALALRQHQKTR